MKPPSRGRGHGVRFNITPLIDVVFLLIIFFLAASHFARSETAEPVELPEAASDEEDRPDESPRRLTVTITADESLHVRGAATAREEVAAMVEAGARKYGDAFELRVRADRRVPYRVVEPLLLDCARSGVVDLKFAVIPKS